MIKLWGMTIKKHRRTADHVAQLPGVWGPKALGAGLAALCEALDVPRPMVLKKHEREMKLFGRTRFSPEDFVEPVPFDSFEMEILRSPKKENARPEA